jgi:maltose alpha-D-glucosyltransferase/alpha-amylase
MRANNDIFTLEDDPTWYKDAVIYELHVRAFYDSNEDGIGDFQGLTEKLDYLQDLGITAIWLLPFYPSPLKDDGYDIADYMQVHPAYGTLADFKVFLRAAHQRGIRVITELVLNHTSDRHEWFQRARRSKAGTVWRDYYVWSDNPEKYKDARIIFKDFETSNWTWDPVAQAYYWHRFYHHQPDLNFNNPEVVRSLMQVVNFWLSLGVDGMRLDAVPYLYEREGTSCENLPETHVFLKKLRNQIDRKYRNRMLLAEANQWPEDAVAYFGNGDECQVAFHFPVMPRMFMALKMEDRFPIIDILSQTPPVPENCQWALFLRNHDELTLEMVTDEERDYMYRTYAHDPQMRVNVGIRRRLTSLLEKDWNKIELMNALLFSLPGTPVLYYGDEIGMGDNIYLGDRNSVRTPMQWSADRNAGFSRTSPHRLYLPIVIDSEYHYEAFNVEAEQNNPHSILWWMKRLIAMRKRFKAFGRGGLEFLFPDNHRVLAFIRRYQDEMILVVANLSRFVQYAKIDLSEFRGTSPVELFGRTTFPAIGDQPYFLTLGPHSFYWFALTRRPEELAIDQQRAARIEVSGEWSAVFTGKPRVSLEQALPGYLLSRRWFGGKAHQIKAATFLDIIPISLNSTQSCFTQVMVEYTEEDPELYLLPLSFAAGERAEHIRSSYPRSVLADVVVNGEGNRRPGIIYDAVLDRDFCKSLVEMIVRKKHARGRSGEFTAIPSRRVKDFQAGAITNLEVSSMRAEQTNSSIVFGDRLILKLFRRFQRGPNPDIEITRFLSEQAAFRHSPAVVGVIEYRSQKMEPAAIGLLQAYVPNEGDAWRQTLDSLSQYFDRTATLPIGQADSDAGSPISLAVESIGPYLENVKLLGKRTAELHLALASDESNPDFAPEPFTILYQRSLYQSMRNHTGKALLLLRKSLTTLPPGDVVEDALRVLDLEKEVFARFRQLLPRKIAALRTRIHGDFHLGQILFTGKDYVIIDFEGEPTRPLTERRIKRSPLRDVAGMLRSFHYAAYTSLFGYLGSANVRPEDLAGLELWARRWSQWISSTFTEAYLAEAASASYLPPQREDVDILLNIYALEKALYEVRYELNNRPDWVRIPLIGILQLMETPKR